MMGALNRQPVIGRANRSAVARLLLVTGLVLATWQGHRAGMVVGQETGPGRPAVARAADAELAAQKAADALAEPGPAANRPGAGDSAPRVDLLELTIAGGWLMLPIALLSIMVVAVTIERLLGLRRCKIIPARLARMLDELVRATTGFEPRHAYRICQQHPSAAATIIGAMLRKVGRPHTEVERAVAEASQREAARLYTSVRTLNLAATVSPLLGLLGTVWGMIKAFMATAEMPIGANKAEHLAEGIYTALVTTFAGLAVAIPAAVLAHLFEGRIQARLQEVDALLFDLLPQVERFEGQTQANQLLNAEPGAGLGSATGATDPVPRQPAGDLQVERGQ